jgi:quercetin dioxygenase-like cupin family protein
MRYASAVTILLALAAFGPRADASPQIQSRTILDTATTSAGEPIVLPSGSVHVVGSIVDLSPGDRYPYHRHPYPRYVYVLSGTLGVQDEHGTTRRYAPGTMFVETAGWHHPSIAGGPVRLLVIDQMPKDVTSNTITR